MIDVLATEYGWTSDYILGLSKSQVFTLLSRIGERKERESIMEEHGGSSEKPQGKYIGDMTPEELSSFNIK